MCLRYFSYCQTSNFDRLQLSTNIHEGTFRILYHIVRHIYINVDIAFEKIKYEYLGDIRRNYKNCSLILCSECVTWSDTLQQGLQELNLTEEGRKIKLGVAAGRNTHCTLYWYSEVNTDLHKGDVIVRTFKLFMYDYPLSTMNSSTRIGVSGARPHSDIFKIIPVGSKNYCLCYPYS